MVSQLDDLLTHLGTGRWSVLHFIAMAYSSLVLAPHTLGGAFLAPRLHYSCRVPSSSTNADLSNVSILLQENSLSSPLSPSPSSSSSTSPSFISEGECRYTMDTPEGQVTQDCVEFDFDNSTFATTFTSEYNLACGRGYLQTAFQSMYMFGIFVAAPINGLLSDKYGRKRMVVIGAVGYLVLGIASAWLPSLSTILAARFVMGCLHAVCSYTSYVLMVEVIEPKMRTAAGFGIYNVWAIGTMLYGGLAYLMRDWRILQTVMTLPGLLLLPALWMIDESPRWLIVNGHPQEALRVLGKVARWHSVDLPPEEEMKQLVETQSSKPQRTSQHSSVRILLKSVINESLVLFRTPRLRIITICVYLDFLVAGMVYFGLSLSGASISDDPFVYMVLSGLMEVPAYTLTIPIVERFGRKYTLSVFFVISAIVLLALAVTPAVYSTTVVTLAMVGKVAISGGFQTVTFFSSELFPTEVRSRGISTSFMMSRIGGMASPFITDLVATVYPWAPFVVFGSGALLAGAVSLLLPETRGQTLPDTVAHLEARRRQVSKE